MVAVPLEPGNSLKSSPAVVVRAAWGSDEGQEALQAANLLSDRGPRALCQEHLNYQRGSADETPASLPGYTSTCLNS